MLNYKRIAPALGYCAAACLAVSAAGCADTPADSGSASPAPTAPAAVAPAAPSEAPVADNAPAPAMTPFETVQTAQASTSVRLAENAPLEYVVKPGDTLWSISQHFIREPWQWPRLWYDNPRIHNPHLIYPGDTLRLVAVNGETRLTDVSTGRLSPTLRESDLGAPLATIRFDAIRGFLNSPRLVSPEELSVAPYVVEFTDEHLVGTGDTTGVFVKDLPAQGPNSYSVVEMGQAYRDPDTGAVLGYEGVPVGTAVRGDHPGKVAEMALTGTKREAQIGDRLLPLEINGPDSDFVPHAPSHPVRGRIISVYDSVMEIGQYDILTLNRGTADGLDAGTVLGVLQSERVVRDPYGKDPVSLPEQRAGLVMVFKATAHVCYAIVMTQTRPVHVLDRVAEPQLTSVGG